MYSRGAGIKFTNYIYNRKIKLMKKYVVILLITLLSSCESNASNSEQIDLFYLIMIYSGVAIAATVIGYYILRWIFDIPKRNRHMEAQTKLLAKIAEMQGVNSEEIKTISRV